MILLFEGPSHGYLFTSVEVDHNIKSDNWHLASDGDHKVHGYDMVGGTEFRSTAELIEGVKRVAGVLRGGK